MNKSDSKCQYFLAPFKRRQIRKMDFRSSQIPDLSLTSILPENKAIKFLKITLLIRIVFELGLVFSGIYSIFASNLNETQDMIILFFSIFILLNFVRMSLNIISFRKMYHVNRFSDIQMNVFEVFIEIFNDIFIYFWVFFGLSLSRILIESKYFVPFHLKAVIVLFWCALVPLFYTMVMHLGVLTIAWYLLQKIPIEKYQNLTEKSSQECLICLNAFEYDENVKIFSCKHYFHVTCVDQWLLRERSCPLCRKPVTRLFDD